MKVEKKTLKNGTRLIMVPIAESPTVTVEVLVETGSNYESEKTSGLSHFLEHMCFKGTLKRKCGQISFDFDSLGAESNAFTGDEYTGYYAKAHYSKLENIFDVVSDVYLNSIFPKEELEKERGVIIEEINMYEDLPQRKVYYIFNSLLYPNSPAGRPTLGPKENIKTFSRDDFLNYRYEQYTPEKTIVIVSGRFDQEKVYQLFDQSFSGLQNRVAPEREINKINDSDKKVSLFTKKTDQVHLMLGLYAPSIYDEDRWAMSLLSTVLGSGMSSRLFKRMREELGICYYIHSSAIQGLDFGYLAISAGVASDRIEEAVKNIIEELKKVTTEEISESELNKAKEFKIGNMAMSLESSDELADYYGFDELYFKKQTSPEEKFEKIRKISSSDLLRVAQKYLKGKKPFLALVGPQEDEMSLDALLEQI